MPNICSKYSETLGKYFKEVADSPMSETFDISGKVDTNNPIYKFYEKDVQKYLNKFGGKRVVDDKGVSWIEVPITKEQGKLPIEAFAVAPVIAVPGAEQDKKLKIKESEVSSELKPVMFGEISNRSLEKKELEARVILSTALNRMKEYALKGHPKTFKEVLALDNQYQAYEGEQYNNYKKGKLDTLGLKKKKEIDTIMDKLIKELREKKFKDVANGAFYYVHNKDGSITYDDTRKLFK